MPAALNIAVLGDSVGWGQGLLPAEKYAYKVAEALGQPPGNVSLQAHSGAIIGISLKQAGTSLDPEIPAPEPTIADQILRFPNPETVDVVIINGGINDVNIRTIFNPLTSLNDLADLTLKYCYYDMLALLGNAIGTFTKPTCRFAVTGYYPILSPQSQPAVSFAGEDPLLKLLEVFAPEFPVIFDRAAVIGKLIQLAEQFAQISKASISKAVSEAIIRYDDGLAIPLSKRMSFVDSGFADENALFAGASTWIWGFQGNLNPEDEVAPTREAACSLQYKEIWQLGDLQLCNHASVGHPNVAGAQAFTDAIVLALNAMAART